MKLYLLLFLAVVSSPAFAADENKCVLPYADNNENRTPSKPSIRGQIVQVKPGLITVQSEGKGERIQIRINAKSELFTIYGGYVAKEELAKGQRVDVWYVGCDSRTAGSPPLAAVVRLESK